MKNGTLVINDNEKLQEDIWQTSEEWESLDWKSNIIYQAEALQRLYNNLCKTEEYGGGNEDLYVLGDVINMLRSIDVKVKGE